MSDEGSTAPKEGNPAHRIWDDAEVEKMLREVGEQQKRQKELLAQARLEAHRRYHEDAVFRAEVTTMERVRQMLGEEGADEIEAIVTGLHMVRHPDVRFILESTSTVYMDGSGIFHIKDADKPGIICTLRLWPRDAAKLTALLDGRKP